jgi:hypothetical protein
MAATLEARGRAGAGHRRPRTSSGALRRPAPRSLVVVDDKPAGEPVGRRGTADGENRVGVSGDSGAAQAASGERRRQREERGRDEAE